MKKKLFYIVSIVLAFMVFGYAVFYFTAQLPKQKEREQLENAMRAYYQSKITLYEEENALYEDFEVDVAFLGDSLTDGYDLAQYYPQYKTANRGIGGETTYGLKNRLEVSVYALKPKIAVLLIGGNNLNTMFEDYENILIGFQNHLPNTKILLLSLTAMGKTLADKNVLAAYNNVKIEKLAEKYGFAFVDLFTPLFDLETGEIHSSYTTDGAHLTAHGYQVLTDAITPALTQLMESFENSI